MQVAIDLFADVVALAMPYAVVFAIGQRVVQLFLGMGCKGEVRL